MNRDTLTDAFWRVFDRLELAALRADEFIERRPVTSLLVAFGLGLVVAHLAHWLTS